MMLIEDSGSDLEVENTIISAHEQGNCNKLCAWRHDMPPPHCSPAPRAPPSRRNVAVVSDAQYVLTVTAAPASRVKGAVSKAA